MLIRPFAIDDIPAAAALLRRAAEEFILPESTPEGGAAFLAEQSEQGLRERYAGDYVYHAAEADGELAGFIGLRARSHLYHLFVDRRWHRRGLARRLWETGCAAALDPARKPAHPGVFTVNASNHAVPFYESIGFVRTAPTQSGIVYYNPMRLVLATGAAADAPASLVDPA